MIVVKKNLNAFMYRRGKQSVISMNQIKYLLFVALLLITPSLYGQNRGRGGYSPSGLAQEFKDIVNNIKTERELSKAVEKNKEVTPEEFRNASKRTVAMVFNHAINKNNYEAAKVMLDYLYDNKYDKAFISKHKTMAMWRIIRQNMKFTYRSGKNCYFKYDVPAIEKWATLLIDKDTDMQYLYDKIVNIPQTSIFDKFIVTNASAVLTVLRNSKYK